MMVSKTNLLFQGHIFRFHVKFQGSFGNSMAQNMSDYRHRYNMAWYFWTSITQRMQVFWGNSCILFPSSHLQHDLASRFAGTVAWLKYRICIFSYLETKRVLVNFHHILTEIYSVIHCQTQNLFLKPRASWWRPPEWSSVECDAFAAKTVAKARGP